MIGNLLFKALRTKSNDPGILEVYEISMSRPALANWRRRWCRCWPGVGCAFFLDSLRLLFLVASYRGLGAEACGT